MQSEFLADPEGPRQALGFVVLDRSGRTIGTCPDFRHFAGLSSEPWIGRPFAEWIRSIERPRWVERLASFSRGERVASFRIGFDRPGLPEMVRVRFVTGPAEAVVVHLSESVEQAESGWQRHLPYLRRLYAGFPVGVALLDAGGVVRWTNDLLARQGGRGWIGRPLSRCLPASGLGKHLARTLREGESWRLQAVELKSAPLGTWRHVDIMLSPVEGPDEGRVGALMMLEDATRMVEDDILLRHQREIQAEVDRLKGRFLSAASHELRTPLTLITGFAEFLEDGLGGSLSEAQSEYVRGIQTGARQMQHMIEELLDFSRLQDGSFALHPHPVDAGRILSEVVQALAARAEEAGTSLELESSQAWMVHADPDALARILHAMIGNALKFTGRGGRVAVRCWLADARLRIEVEDDGAGVDVAHARHVFERFYQADGGLTRLHGGAGLGLSMARALVEGHRGRMGLMAGHGAGVTFWFELPARSGPRHRL